MNENDEGFLQQSTRDNILLRTLEASRSMYTMVAALLVISIISIAVSALAWTHDRIEITWKERPQITTTTTTTTPGK